ncbi:MAG: cytochrome c biogenesis protein CcdA [Roseovarius sp.]|nr:cytochrome c biogenesis protein CcdA [Roseovarius sp.]MCY4207296.1 cytochrome c biogenesis protein CcdA [Roseovarius sp.]MCY4291380.1 cytochrome c biogenesis protein CcdA [Roseovarius sp.]MCY4314792.1 cytochrome c biogenesis protein CcdA [Roseovarius sp.]
MFDITLWGAFIGGLVVFFSPCILPIVPFYLGYMAGSGLAVLNGEGELPPGLRLRAVISSMSFSAGIITVFVLLGATAFAASRLFGQYQLEFRYAAAAIVFLMGLHFLGVFRIGFLDRQFRFEAGGANAMSLFGSYVVGLAFAAGWTPCVGGVLTAVLLTAGFEETAWRGVGLLVVFGVGLTLPFVIAALFIKPFLRFASRFRRHLPFAEKTMGLLLIGFSVLLMTNQISVIANWMLEASRAI